ncbi:MAG: hypothetical protein OXI59_14875 [Gemmatimonadota bacterium]|nr:hypothetical protein [Gemmatimonadota bacterium]MYD62092.1 hypothetical protein [Gemmatimonadota bacterium]
MKVMKVVISCAGSKADNAGYMKTKDEKCVNFVGNPAKVMSREPGFCYARPDGEAGDSKTWRDKLIAYNESCVKANPLGLLPAYKLYTPNKPYKDIYTQLVEVFGIDNVYILSAGWGLIQASFLTPKYDITFNGSADAYKQRNYKHDCYNDFNHLESAIDEDLLFLGGQGYLPLFCDRTRHYQGRRVSYYNSAKKPKCDDVKLVHYETEDKYRWVYECATKVIECYKSDPCGFDPRKMQG